MLRESAFHMCDRFDLIHQSVDFAPLHETAKQYSSDFISVFCEKGKIVAEYVSANESLFLSKYSSLIGRFYDGSDGRRSMFTSIFFTWVRIELFLYHYEWMRDSFMPYYEKKEWDEVFWSSLINGNAS